MPEPLRDGSDVMSPEAGLGPHVVEFFALRDAEKEAGGVPNGVRAVAERATKLAFQGRAAAETLWTRGSQAEALRIARGALETIAPSLEAFGAHLGRQPEWMRRALALAEGASLRHGVAAVAELDSDLKPGDASLFRATSEALSEIEAVIGPHLAEPAEITQVGRRRVVNAIAAAAVVVTFVAWWRHPAPVTARASSRHNDDDASRALDSTLRTNWAPADGDKGWFELVLDPPRAVNALQIVPYNFGYDNRYTKEVQVTAYLHDMAVRSMDYTFSPPREDPTVTVPLASPTCDRVRIEVKSFSGISASISEIEIR